MTEPIRILIADDHPLMRAGISAEINAESDMRVVAGASNGVEALSLYREHRPDVSLVDLRMPIMNGLDLIAEIRSLHPPARIVVLTTSAADVHAVKAFRAGASGYLLKHMLRGDLIETIRAVHRGVRKIPAEIAQLLAEHALDEALTSREIEVVERVGRGLSNKQIGASLFISEYTVKGHLKTIMSKLNASDRTHAVMIAVQRGFIEP